MTNATVIAIVAVIAVAAVVLAWFYIERRRRERIRTRFGPEYQRTVREAGDPRRAESILERREKRVSQYPIRTLTPDERVPFSDAWRQVQGLFVDDPGGAVSQGDALVTDLMAARGYPMNDFERRAEDLSVDHPVIVQHYREARAIAERHERKAASTEDLRQALVHYRALFDDLLGTAEPQRRRA